MAKTNGHGWGGGSSIKGRLGALERTLLPRETTDEKDLTRYEEDYKAQLETTATDLVLSLGPDLSFRDDAFYAPDGRLALSSSYMDIAAIMGPGYEERMQELQVEAWKRCLDKDERAEEIVGELFEMAEDTEAPPDYWTWLSAWPIGAEYLAEGYHAGRTPPASEEPPSGCDGEPPMNPEDREKARRLAWALINNPEARSLLAELCELRERYVEAA